MASGKIAENHNIFYALSHFNCYGDRVSVEGYNFDLNTLQIGRAAHYHKGNGSLNTPSSSYAGEVYCYCYDWNGNHRVQIACDYSGSGIFIRTESNAGVWNDWKPLYTA